MKINKVEGAVKPLVVNEVEVREAMVKDLIQAERISGKAQAYEFLSGVISQCCKFDGQAQPPEEVQRLGMTDFLELTEALGLNGQAISPDTSSTSSGKESSENPVS